jgi:hypothetical protein
MSLSNLTIQLMVERLLQQSGHWLGLGWRVFMAFISAMVLVLALVLAAGTNPTNAQAAVNPFGLSGFGLTPNVAQDEPGTILDCKPHTQLNIGCPGQNDPPPFLDPIMRAMAANEGVLYTVEGQVSGRYRGRPGYGTVVGGLDQVVGTILWGKKQPPEKSRVAWNYYWRNPNNNFARALAACMVFGTIAWVTDFIVGDNYPGIVKAAEEACIASAAAILVGSP